MGMDVYGKNPTSEKGSYFRNNVWYWHPLWDYCLNLHGDICEKVEHGHHNDGDGLDAFDASLLADRLFHDLEVGVTEQYAEEYRKYIAELPFTDCKWCDATGIRTDEVGVNAGMPTKELDEEKAIIYGRTHGYCNGCGGAGKCESWASNYPFDVDNVREFAEFLRDCGGFEIC